MANDITELQAGYIPADGLNKVYTMEKEISLALLASSDVKYALTLPAGHKCLHVDTEVTEATGETCTVGVDMATDLTGTLVSSGTGWDASVNVNSLGLVAHDAPGTDAHATAGGYRNKAAVTYIVVVPNVSSSPLGALGKLKVVATCVEM